MTTSAQVDALSKAADEITRVLKVPFTGEELIQALRESNRPQGLVQLPVAQRSIWESGVRADAVDPAAAAAHNSIARTLFVSSSWDAKHVAEYLGVSPSTVRHYSKDRKLFSFLYRNRLKFPQWQFIGGEVLPGLEEVLPTIPGTTHPQAVTGFFTSTQPELVIDGRSVTPIAWLASGENPEIVAIQAASLGSIL